MYRYQPYDSCSVTKLSAITSASRCPYRTITFQDPARSNRNIETEIYYPATTPGNNVSVASGQFPIIVYGHGFVMGVSAYENIWLALVPLGYIVALPTTESGAPSHSDFGSDLAFLINTLKAEGADNTSPFYQKKLSEAKSNQLWQVADTSSKSIRQLTEDW